MTSLLRDSFVKMPAIRIMLVALNTYNDLFLGFNIMEHILEFFILIKSK